LWYDNPTPEQVLSLIGRVKPDIMTFDEVSAKWRGEITKISATYPYQFFCSPRRGASGTAIISRRPFRTDTKPHCFSGGVMAVASIELGGPAFQVGALHLTWPWPFHQPGQLELLRPALSTLGDTVLLAGDFNATAWSAAMRRIEADGGLTHIGGIGPTWLDAHLPDVLRRYAGLPIDQVLSKGEVEIISAKTLESVGSDHLPVLVEFAFGAGEPGEDAGTETVMLAR
jgi:endonuclease/exonuclease/phosphatase (EEP) superfamily protein YafD